MRDTRELVFDAQVFQTPAWHRGMGKYSLEFIIALNNLNKITKRWRNIELIISNNIETEESVFKTLETRAPEVKFIKLGLDRNEYDNRPVANRNRKVVDSYFRKMIYGRDNFRVDYIVLSLMQSEVAPAFSSLQEVHNYVLFYDLIPLMFNQTYLSDLINQKGYLSKISELLRADSYLAISRTVANDLTTLLGIDKQRVISIDGAPITHGDQPKEIDVPKPFILMPTGNDLRKNNRRGVEGFEIFNKKNANKFHLVVTSVFQEDEMKELKKISKNVIFTGNVSGEELVYLYDNTDTLLFPTEYEGLGLPILEALEKSKPVACSDISVFREISDRAFHYFNPKNTDEIALSLEAATSTKTLPLTEYKRVVSKFTWGRTAGIFAEYSSKQNNMPGSGRITRLAIFCSSPDESPNGVELQQLYSEMVRICTPRFYMDANGLKNKGNVNYLVQIADVINIARPTKITFFNDSLPVYIIENTPNCAAILLVALANQGVVVLKDSTLTSLWCSAVERGLVDKSRMIAEVDIEKGIRANGLLTTLISRQKYVVVHDNKLKKVIESTLAMLNLSEKPEVVLMPAPAPVLVYDELRQDLSLLDYKINKSSGTTPTSSFAEYARVLYELATNKKATT